MSREEGGRSDSRSNSQSTARWLLDWGVKLIAAMGVVFAVYVAKQYESKMSATTLLNQREQAESNLRAAMFHDLIDPVVGKPSEGKPMDADRVRLLVELLTLNFHEHFEFKPLLLEVDYRLRDEILKKDKNYKKYQQGRDSLRSVARRVFDRQVNMLRAEGERTNEKIDPVRVYFKKPGKGFKLPGLHPKCDSWAEAGRETENNSNTQALFDGHGFSQTVCVTTQDKAYRLALSVESADFRNQEVKVQVAVFQETPSGGEVKPRDNFSFTLTPFDFPLTDNTEIDVDHRFAVSLDHMNEETKDLSLTLIWFPKKYITPRERPINYREIREILKLEKERPTVSHSYP
mgnify:CR=1 FL=1